MQTVVSNFLVRPTSHIRPSDCASTPAADASRKGEESDPSPWGRTTYVGELDGAPECWL